MNMRELRADRLSLSKRRSELLRREIVQQTQTSAIIDLPSFDKIFYHDTGL